MNKGNTMAKKQKFEDAMESLENIVQELESGDLSLEKAMQRFEEGIKLSKFCSNKLDETEKKITLLTANADGSVNDHPFSNDDVND
jgi:exodeoxyribonuclease VII small subunit